MLRAAGFKKRGSGWNRHLESGIVHAIELVLGPQGWARPTERVLPSEALFGSFILRFGVYVPEMDRLREARGWIYGLSCVIQTDTTHLRFGNQVERVWSESGDDPRAPAFRRPVRPWASLWDDDAPSIASAALSLHGLPWLDRFPDHEAIVRAYMDGDDLGVSPPDSDTIAFMLVNLGRRGEALGMLNGEPGAS